MSSEQHATAADPGPRDPRAFDLLVIGDCNPDVLAIGGDVTPAFDQQEKLVGSMALVVGGSASITAIAAARLGLRVALVAAIGDDAAGNFMLAELTRAGVDTGGVAVRAQLPTGMTIALSRGDDRAILTAEGAISTLTSADVPADMLSRARHVHVSSYFLLERSLGPGLAALLAAAKAAGATTSLDTNWDPAGTWGAGFFPDVLAQTDLLLPNEAEALRIAAAATLPDAVASLTRAGGAPPRRSGTWRPRRRCRRWTRPVPGTASTLACWPACCVAAIRRLRWRSAARWARSRFAGVGEITYTMRSHDDRAALIGCGALRTPANTRNP